MQREQRIWRGKKKRNLSTVTANSNGQYRQTHRWSKRCHLDNHGKRYRSTRPHNPYDRMY